MALQENALTGKVALITGASAGIGAETARLFSKLGALLSLTDRNEEGLHIVGAQCENKSKEKPLLTIGDVNIDDDVQRIVEDTIRHFGKLDILVNNAGFFEGGSIETTDMDQFDRIFRTNVRSVYQFTMLCAPHLVKTKGNIINMSSINGLRVFPNDLAYCMSKSCIDQMTRCVALELAPKGVRCNSVNPGAIKTEIHKKGGMTDEQVEAFYERCKRTHALGRAGEVEEVAKAITVLASDCSSFITGVNMPVDGGRHAMCPPGFPVATRS